MGGACAGVGRWPIYSPLAHQAGPLPVRVLGMGAQRGILSSGGRLGVLLPLAEAGAAGRERRWA